MAKVKKELSHVDKARLDKVLEVLRQKNVRFPVAEIESTSSFTKGHISSILSGKIPMSKNFYDTILKQYGGVEVSIPVKNSDGKTLEALIRIEARQLAQGAYISEIYSKLFEVPATKVLKDMEQMGKDEARRLLDELK